VPSGHLSVVCDCACGRGSPGSPSTFAAVRLDSLLRRLRIGEFPTAAQAQRHGLPVEYDGAANSTAHWNRSLLPALRIPVGRNAGCCSRGPPFAEVVVNEVLPEEQIRLRLAASVRERPNLLKQRAQNEGSWPRNNHSIDSSGPRAVLHRPTPRMILCVFAGIKKAPVVCLSSR
jgi:hypothetical protein